ncbi:MAG: Flp pilus assembly protein CpaB [Planctomycetaceae bacterium]|nr:Flp pilus assembly protein CpaB [Planctomycetaceae bacterium]
MKPKTLISFVVAGGCGLMALFGFQAMQSSKPQPKVETAKVLVALEEIEAGAPLTETNVTFRDTPVASLPKDPVVNEEQFKERSALIPMMPGDIVSLSKLTEPGVRGASSQIPKGWRVSTISVTDVHTNSGMLRPGDRVDVLVVYKARSGRATVTKTKTLLEYVEVFATDDQTASRAADASGDAKKAKSVSLLLTPEQVNYVLLAQTKGSLSLSWRHRMDDELVQVGEIDDELLEELEGTVGIYEDRPLYDQVAPEEMLAAETSAEPEAPAHPETATGPPASPSDFLGGATQGVAPVAPPGQVPQPHLPQPSPIMQSMQQPGLNRVAGGQETWTVQVYNGNSPQAQVFAVEKPNTGFSLSDGLKSMFGGSR